MTQRDPANQPMEHNPNEPHRNPNLMQPGHDPHEIDQRPTPKPSRRTSSLWAWVFLGGVALVILTGVFLLGGTNEIADVPTDGTLPAGEPTIDAQ
ncbi:MAG: hypothetical protein JJU21_00095 [Salinarimonas sp.]|nr:hypothetical protein [Salinarimonas sp.]